ncbi:MAG: dimethyl sulfoxide reductase anchor subunit [Actinobacteria bacterium]|nr:dimethyl sulfoxide reductase anchor subunit [Actinomycetota bacterium]MBW3649313.1 dimethyl sulfoxide reductase anchor subunit [Actinomycetota bacterium]
MIAPEESFTGPTLIDRYLASQGTLTAIEDFATRHDAGFVPSQARYYENLIPLAEPLPGQQYGFEVDLDACTGCKACVTACHSLNGLDEDESWRSVGMLHGGTPLEPFQQTVTTACHHCVDPACLNGCPVDAYEKDPVTGIVIHLDDQCIGCSYCTLTCPYEVPRFNPAKGIVRKCDMCRDRLSVGEAPACVQACPNGAIKIKVIETAGAVAASVGASLVPGAPPSSTTVPTTVYLTKKNHVGRLQAADWSSLRPASNHPPLAIMLVLTQLSVGAFVTDLLLRAIAGHRLASALQPYNAIVAVALGFLALGASVLHLGRPAYAFRAVIGFRHSWLSREIVSFGSFALVATLYAGVLWATPSSQTRTTLLLGILVSGVGMAAVGCSVMVYAVTSRSWWSARRTATKFTLTSVVAGLATVIVTSTISAMALGPGAKAALAVVIPPLALILAATSTTKLVWEALFLLHRRDRETSDHKRTALLLTRDLATSTRARFAAGVLGGTVIPLALAGLARADQGSPALLVLAALLGLMCVVGGELIERSQFFQAVSSPRMPGGRP